ncbi:MAG: tyrosine-type recombinase/integrase [Candidatus Bipolaricaulia bacterium]
MKRAKPIKDLWRIKAIKDMLQETGNLNDAKYYALFTVGINTGLRFSDLSVLKWGDVLDDDGLVKERIQITMKKTGRGVEIYLNEAAREALEYYHQLLPLPVQRTSTGTIPTPISFYAGDYLFPGRNGKPLTRQAATERIKKICEKVGLKGSYGVGSFRKTWACHAYDAGVRIEIIMQRLGHESPAQTKRYIGITQEEVEEAERRVVL